MTVPPRFFVLPADTVHVLCLNLAEQRAAPVTEIGRVNARCYTSFFPGTVNCFNRKPV